MKRFIILCFLFLPFLCSCVKEVTMDAMEDPQIVVECILCDEPVQTLYLTYTKGASREVAPELSEAEASLTDLTEGREVGRFARAEDGSWQLSYTAIPLHNYRLDVSVPGREPIWAEQTMPEVPSLGAEWNWWRENLPAYAKYRKDHGYIFSVDTLRNPVWFYGMNYPDLSSNGVITENLATDYPEVDKFNEQTSTYSGNAVFDSRYFRLSSYPDLMTAVNHRHYLRFPAREAERTEFLVSGDFRGYLEDKTDFVHSRKRFPELHYFAVSEDYDKYLTDSYHLEQVSNSSDLSAIFLRDNVYTNVHGAVGIFGAKIERTLLWEGEINWGSGPFLFSGLESRIVDYTIGDRSPFYKEEEYRGYDMYPYDEEEKNRVTNIKSVNWQSHRDFSLLHYEVRGGIPDDWKYGIKDAKVPVNAGTYPTYYLFKQAVYRIDDEEQLREHGLEEYGPVDFTLNTVIVAYARGNWRAYFPYLVDYLVSEDRTNGRCRHMFYWAHIADNGWTQHSIGILRAEEWYVLNPAISSRVALVVDKIGDNDELCLSWDSYIAASTRMDEHILLVKDEILPEMGVTDFNVLVEIK